MAFLQILLVYVDGADQTENDVKTELHNICVMLKDRIQEIKDAEQGMDDFIKNPQGKN